MLEKPKTTRVENVHAAQYMVECVKAHPGEITLAVLGPMTNVALAVQVSAVSVWVLNDMERIS